MTPSHHVDTLTDALLLRSQVQGETSTSNTTLSAEGPEGGNRGKGGVEGAAKQHSRLTPSQQGLTDLLPPLPDSGVQRERDGGQAEQAGPEDLSHREVLAAE